MAVPTKSVHKINFFISLSFVLFTFAKVGITPVFNNTDY